MIKIKLEDDLQINIDVKKIARNWYWIVFAIGIILIWIFTIPKQIDPDLAEAKIGHFVMLMVWGGFWTLFFFGCYPFIRNRKK